MHSKINQPNTKTNQNASYYLHTNAYKRNTNYKKTHNLTIPIQNQNPRLGDSYAIQPVNRLGLLAT